jgi:hypothetical protein
MGMHHNNESHSVIAHTLYGDDIWYLKGSEPKVI